MLCCAPWRAMLPPGIRENMPRLVVMGMGGNIPGVPRNKVGPGVQVPPPSHPSKFHQIITQ